MRNTTLWRPTHDVTRMAAEADELFRRLRGTPASRTDENQDRSWAPPADIWETDEAYFIRLDIPGIDRGAVNLSVRNDSLNITGERQMTGEQENRQYYRIERRYGTFQRTFEFARPIDTDAIEANFRDGVLDIRIPKTPETRPRRIEIQ